MPIMTDANEIKAKLAFRGRMAHTMLDGYGGVDLRTALALQISGLLNPL